MTERAEHTAGPWKVFICDDGKQWTGWPLSVYAVNDEDKSIVRPGGFYPYEWDSAMIQREAVANARLIAAAPDLLAACQEFVRKVECGEAKSTRSYEQMKAAITRATGEA